MSSYLAYHLPFIVPVIIVAIFVRNKIVSIVLGASIIPLISGLFLATKATNTVVWFQYFVLSYLSLVAIYSLMVCGIKKKKVGVLISLVIVFLCYYPQPSLLANFIIEHRDYYRNEHESKSGHCISWGDRVFIGIDKVLDQRQCDSVIILESYSSFNKYMVAVEILYKGKDRNVIYNMHKYSDTGFVCIGENIKFNGACDNLIQDLYKGMSPFRSDPADFILIDGPSFFIYNINYKRNLLQYYFVVPSVNELPNNYRLFVCMNNLFESIASTDSIFAESYKNIFQ